MLRPTDVVTALLVVLMVSQLKRKMMTKKMKQPMHAATALEESLSVEDQLEDLAVPRPTDVVTALLVVH